MQIFKSRTIIFIVLAISLSSCFQKYQEFDINSEAQLIAPVAYGDFLLGDILEGFNEDSIFKTDSNNELLFSYSEENIASINFDEFIDIPSSIEIVEKEQRIGNIELKPYSFREILTLTDLRQRLSDNELINLLPENTYSIFPEIILGDESSDQLKFEIQDFDFLQYGHFVDGEITCVFRNSFPANCKVNYLIIDEEGEFIEELDFGTNNPTGLKPDETEVKVIDLTGKSISAPLYYQIISLHFFESESPVYIQLTDNFRLNAELTNMVIDEGIINSESFEYKTDPEQIAFEIGDTIKLTRAIIQEANLQIKIQKTFKPDGDLTVYFPYLFKDGIPYEVNIPLTNNSKSTYKFDLNGAELLFSNEIEDYNSIEFYIEFKTNEDEEVLSFKADDSFKYSFSLLNLSFSYLEGDFGNFIVDLSQPGVGIDPGLWDNIGANIFGENPTMKLIFSNPVGIPTLLDVQIDASNLEGESVSLIAEPYILAYPENVLEAPKVSELEFNSSNSSIADFMHLPPNNELNFIASIELNPRHQDMKPFSNFVLLTEPFNIGLEIEIPLLLSGVFFEMTDTIPLNLSNIDNLIQQAEIIFKTKNTMPLQVDLKVFPFDSISKTKTGDELFVTLLEASVVDDSGNFIKATEAENSLVLDNDAIQSLSIANSLLVNAVFMSPNNGESFAKLKNEYGFDLKVVLDVKPNL